MDIEKIYTLGQWEGILERLAETEKQIDELTAKKNLYREVLLTFRQDGTIGDTLECNGDQWKYQRTHTKWTYSKDLTAQIKRDQQLEQAEGIATKSVTYGWKRYPYRPKL